MKQILFTATLLFCCGISFAQVQIAEPTEVSNMLLRYSEINKSITKISGWRVLILGTQDRVLVEETKQRFLFRYPNIPADWIHDKPFYNLRAGAFESKLDAQRLLNIIRQEYPNATLTRDNNVKPIELIF